MNDLTTVTFNGGSFLTTEIDGVPHVAMKPVVRNVGLDWSSQYKKLMTNPRWTNGDITTVGEDGKNRTMTALPVDQLPDWFHNINTAKIPDPEIRESILLYQQEGCRALNDYWRKGVAARPDAAIGVSAEAIALITSLVRAELERTAIPHVTVETNERFYMSARQLLIDEWGLKNVNGKHARYVSGLLSKWSMRKSEPTPLPADKRTGEKVRFHKDSAKRWWQAQGFSDFYNHYHREPEQTEIADFAADNVQPLFPFIKDDEAS